jgi:hypothetical protein
MARAASPDILIRVRVRWKSHSRHGAQIRIAISRGQAIIDARARPKRRNSEKQASVKTRSGRIHDAENHVSRLMYPLP